MPSAHDRVAEVDSVTSSSVDPQSTHQKSVSGSDRPGAGLEPSAKDKDDYPGLAAALDPGPPSFDAVVTSRIYRKRPPAQNDDEAAAMRRFYRTLFRAFAHAHGVPRVHWCNHAEAAAALTPGKRWRRRHQRMWLAFNPKGRWRQLEDLLASCVDVNHEIEYHLRSSVRKRWQEALYDLVTMALAMLDDLVASDHGPAPALGALRDASAHPDTNAGYLEQRLAGLRTHIDRASTRTLQLRYVWGMAAGALAVGAVALPLLLHSLYLGLVSAAAGAGGAVVSTLVRMSHKHGLQLDSQLAPTDAVLLGCFRILLGAAFGFVLYLLLRATSVSVEPSAAAHMPEFYAVLAFASGFSERLVPDTLGVVGMITTDGQSTERKGE